jgi:hypothetical protein
LKLPFCDRAPRSLRSLQKYPRFALRPSERLRTLQCSPQAPADGGPAKFRRTGGQDRPGAGGGRLEGSLGSIPIGVWGGGGAGGVARRRRPLPAVVRPAPARSRPGQRNERRGELSGGLGSKLGGLSRDGRGVVWGSTRSGQWRRGGVARCGKGVACARGWPTLPLCRRRAPDGQRTDRRAHACSRPRHVAG